MQAYSGLTAAFIVDQLLRGGMSDIKTAGVVDRRHGRNHFHAATVFAVIALLSLLMYGDNGGLRRLIIGKDGRFSTSFTQAALWTLALSYGLLYLLLRSNLCTGGTRVRPDPYGLRRA